MHHEGPVSTMPMTFVLSTSTPLFWASWQPQNAGDYAATCIFLVVLAAWTRVLMAIRHTLERASWGRKSSYPAYHRHKVGGDEETDEHIHGSGSSIARPTLAQPVKPVSGAGIILMGLRSYWLDTPPSLRLARAGFDMAIAGHAYLVMLAVMTMNVGYFLAVLIGVFAGTFLFTAAKDNNGGHQDEDEC
ncbi:hypothetical protein QC761_404770 [Podospora bellae-mahoneyi]|uniref:Copper transport protein n=1 Tax=Podospora bellae-mahoneyi TaxID=2093777 RepID=A0ABR0FK57_9PEZI|nr:hypothetical protein QC761_404770 [Podospora bellae-mahoneyi]